MLIAMKFWMILFSLFLSVSLLGGIWQGHHAKQHKKALLKSPTKKEVKV